ncbi:C6 zinc finger domain containing protein [Pleurostoma richardsiae]|uniref:C6 zinc finger domain containing protein n=1 Tax=Pleurostoma richardsiae TaxID=41990 RepID=A0AA38RGY3_9PEZI|nr:C6 zinc finger domain containing protein [Pleurostoma richardsiae]
MMTRMNNDCISENLLKIYHDVLEHNFSCWVTEETCPYTISRRARNGSKATHGILGSPIAISTERRTLLSRQQQQELGPRWSNRIYHRVIKLDRIAQATGLIRLTRTQDQAVQKTLHLVIMAFATQWAQGSRRERENYTAGFADSWLQAEQLGTFGNLAEEFDRGLQRSMWEQARKALQDCSDIESYRLVCAELIFGLTQRPWEDSDLKDSDLNSEGTLRTDGQGGTGVRDSALSKITEILSREGPPVFMETAARKIRALKFSFDGHESDLMPAENEYPSPSGQESSRMDTISAEDKETVGLLYWLAVMFDTISSSMNERPVVVADEDSQHEAAQETDIGTNPGRLPTKREGHRSERWRIDLFIQDNPDASSHSQLRWPCSYDEAAHMVTKSAPVKVLLYRYVHYLQHMIRHPRAAFGEPIEETIRDTLVVYRYWNVTYGAFFRDLIEQWTSVPARIRGWFVCIAAHWHLAALMLADLVEIIDRNGLGLLDCTQSRVSASTVSRIRKSNARQLSDLARVATPVEDMKATPQMPDFHFAVSEGTILTEPWTMILIRAFAKASILYLGEVDDPGPRDQADLLGHEREDCREGLRRCEDCIRALWFLGKKSDMARNVATVLSKALKASEIGISTWSFP